MQLWKFLSGTVACVALSGATPLAEVKEISKELLDHHEIHKCQLEVINAATDLSNLMVDNTDMQVLVCLFFYFYFFFLAFQFVIFVVWFWRIKWKIWIIIPFFTVSWMDKSRYIRYMKIYEREGYLFSLSKKVCERKLTVYLFAVVFTGYQYICYASVSALQHWCKVVDIGWCNASFREGITNPSVRISLSNIYDELTGRFIGRKYFKFSKLNLVATLVKIEVLLLPHADLFHSKAHGHWKFTMAD